VSDPSAVAARVAEVRARIDAAAAAAGRSGGSVLLVAATKTQPVAMLRALLAAGVRDLGENRAQELLAKAPALAPLEPVWHFIGRLQRNKVNQLRPWVALWQSVDRAVLADALASRVPGARVLVEVNVGEEPQKGGCAPAEAPALVERLRAGGARVEGLMTVAPAAGDPRRAFARLRGLGETLGLAELSMGMSNDYEAAVAEGATIVRLGTALTGPRSAFH
jgi:pyridoxal phosphate enzyme (YggS family)